MSLLICFGTTGSGVNFTALRVVGVAAVSFMLSFLSLESISNDSLSSPGTTTSSAKGTEGEGTSMIRSFLIFVSALAMYEVSTSVCAAFAFFDDAFSFNSGRVSEVGGGGGGGA